MAQQKGLPGSGQNKVNTSAAANAPRHGKHNMNVSHAKTPIHQHMAKRESITKDSNQPDKMGAGC